MQGGMCIRDKQNGGWRPGKRQGPGCRDSNLGHFETANIIGEAREDQVTSEGLARTGGVREVCRELLEDCEPWVQ